MIDPGDGDNGENDEDLDPVPMIAGVVPVELALASNDAAALVLQGMRARPDGFQLTIRAYWRVPNLVNGSWVGFDADVPPIPSASEWQKRFPNGFRRDEHELDEEGNLRGEIVRVLVEFDGCSASNVDCMAWTLDREAANPVAGMWTLGARGASYGPGTYAWHEGGYWVWPLPTGPIMTFACEWPVFDIPVTRTEIATAPLLEAATRARPVWHDWTNRSPSPTRARRQPLV